uniref:recombinase RecT n=1 Tax=Streptococcus pluranimalium TaxID=82348 RepID=UPI003F68F2A0
MTNNQLTTNHNSFFKSPAVKNRIEQVVGKRAEQFTTSLLSIISNNTLLAKATSESIMGAAMKAAVLNLPIEPSLGFAYVVPYNRKYKDGTRWVTINEAQFQIGYRGLIQLAQRSGQIRNIEHGIIYEEEFLGYDKMRGTLKLTGEYVDSGNIKGYFASLELINGFYKMIFWPKEKVLEHARKYSKTYDQKTGQFKAGTPWATEFDSMAIKTLLKELLSKYAPLSVEMQDALDADNIDSTISIPRDVTPTEPVETLDAILGGQTEDKLAPTEDIEEQGEPKRAHKDVIPVEKVVVAESETTTDTSYPESEIPNFDEETGEVAEEISLFEGNTTKIKE